MRSSELMKRLGITREMLRYYEKEQLIAPSREEENGYRQYTQQDGFELLRIKDLQAHRLSIQEVRKSLTYQTLNMQQQQLLSIEQNLQEQIRSLTSQLSRIQRHRLFIEDSMAEEHKVTELNTYGIYKLMLLGEGVPDAPETKGIAAEWLQNMPFTEIGWTLPWPDTFDGQSLHAQIGLISMPHCAFERNLTTDSPVYFFPPGKSLLVMVSTDDPFSVPAAAFSPLAEYARAHRYHVISDISGRYSGFDYRDGKKRYFFSARVLVKKIK